MSENNNVLFIINKFSGAGYRKNVEGRIITACGKLGLECVIEFTRERGHATELAKNAADNSFKAVFAVGGDGTVNEVARSLIHQETAMGILPKGSGNGLARHLGIPMLFTRALRTLESKKIITMDTILINDQLSVNVAGIGFDGHIAGLFGKNGKRGLAGYGRLVLKEFLKYKESAVEISIDGNPIDRKAFIVALANSSQFGNNARVSPHASVCDQLVDVCVIRKVPLAQVAGFTYKMFSGQFGRSAFVEIRQAKKVTLQFPRPMAYHIDGESMEPAKTFSIAVQPKSLKMVVPDQSRKTL